MNVTDPDIHGILRDNWGYDSFRPAQESIIRAVLSGRDTIGLLPTGGGKSLTFQIPALAIEGLTIVISPLISLMKDQVDNLRARGIMAVYLHSGLTYRENRLAIDRCRLGKAKILYLSPEKLSSPTFVDILRLLPVSLIVVDEAHCISQWGYDFRPSYLNIAMLRRHFKSAPVLALTASATPMVVDDIAARLEMTDPHIERLSFTRDNISYIVRYCDHKESKLIEILTRIGGCAIVYVRSRIRTRIIAEELRAAGIKADYYHAGLMPEEKERRQNDWKNDITRVIVATNAFGMGIDKPDVRIVVHVDIPSSLEEYYQEAGRAGRDGRPSLAVVLASKRDKATLTRRLTETFPDKEYIRNIYTLVCAFIDVPVGGGYNSIYEFSLPVFCKRHQLQPAPVVASLHLLTQAGYIEYSDEISTRSRVMITVRRDELYHHDFSETTERVLNVLLRSYTGLFADYVHIVEATMAVDARVSEQEVYEALLALSRMKIIDYVPRKTASFIFFPTSREESRHITIPRAVYENRKDILAGRIESIKRFVYDLDRCRVVTMLDYFGEKGVDDCGQCDICRERRQRRDSSLCRLKERVSMLLRNGKRMKVVDIAGQLNVSVSVASDAIRHMADEGIIDIDPDDYSVWLIKAPSTNNC